jgi:hypothetical protein
MLFSDAEAGTWIPGYHHSAANSRFSRGDDLLVLDEPAEHMRREVGSNGHFVEYANGYSAGIPNGDAESYAVGPYSLDSGAHSQRVLHYFKGAGLPVDQIGGVGINTWMSEGGRVPLSDRETGALPELRKLIGYVTVVQRVVLGVPVEDSFAWAMFNKNDDVVYEQVWWPELRGSIIADIVAFQARLKDGGFVGRLLREDGEGRLVVHHATPTGERWYSQVTYDVWRKGDAQVRSFDVSGNETQLVAWSSPASGPK